MPWNAFKIFQDRQKEVDRTQLLHVWSNFAFVFLVINCVGAKAAFLQKELDTDLGTFLCKNIHVSPYVYLFI